MVPNPSFEFYTSCPTGGGQVNKAFPWFSPTFNTPAYNNQCSTNFNSSVPDNQVGYQYPKTGNAYVTIATFYGTPEGRAYIETPLLDTLIKKKKYCVEIYISLADGSNLASDGIGIYFSKDSVYDYTTLYYLPYSPQVKNPDGNIIRDTVNWILVSGEFIAGGGEKFLTIGNFKDDATTNIDTVGGPWFTYALYYIDDVSVYLCDTTAEASSTLFIPNSFTPNHDGKNEEFKVQAQNIKEFKGMIYNRWGELLYEWGDVNGSWDGQYKGKLVPDGMYVYKIKAKGKDGVEHNRRGIVTVMK